MFHDLYVNDRSSLFGIGKIFSHIFFLFAFKTLGNRLAVRLSRRDPISFGKKIGCAFRVRENIFTSLLIVPWLEKAVSLKGVIKNLVLVYIGNFIGSILLAAGIVFSHQVALFDNGVAVSVISTAVAKCNISFGDALIKGILCNFLVCIAVWISFAAKDIVGKIIGLFFPILMFVLCGFEHSVANMYYLFAGLFAKAVPAFADAAIAAGVDPSAITAGNIFIGNLLPVTIGNIIGGAICVGLPYWYIYLRRKKKMDILTED